MSADTQSTAQPSAQDAERFVKIPKALPGQEYKAPKNFQNPLIRGIYRFVVVALSLSLPLAPAVTIFMILAYSKAIQFGLLWLWIPMAIFIEVIAIGIAWGVAREALGISGVSYARPQR